jgi:histidine triad (HIT) family protein
MHGKTSLSKRGARSDRSSERNTEILAPRPYRRSALGNRAICCGMPLRLPVEDRCTLCAYVAGERRYTILERAPLTASLVTFEQRGLGHIVVVPVEHRVTLLDLAPEEGAAVMAATIRAARAIQAAYDPEGIAVWQNNGIPAHQSIPHVHVHVAGTLPEGGTNWGDVPRLSFEETDELAGRLRPHLPSAP